MSRRSAFELMQTLEARVLLSSHLDHEIFYPEGYAHDGITEVVELNNPGAAAAAYELWAQYERGQRDQLIASGNLGAGSRGNVLITEEGRDDNRLVRTDVPYALVLRSTEALEAELRHNDFGGETAEVFTTATATRWAIADVSRDSDDRGFIVFFNPGEDAVNVQLELIDADSPISVARSEYNLGRQRASSSLGVVGGGDTAGAILSLEFEKRLAPGGPSASISDTTITIFNTSSEAAEVRLTFLTRDDSRSPGTLPAPLTVNVDAHERASVSLRDLGFGEREEVSVLYEADRPVAVAAHIERAGGIFGISAQTRAATEWRFFDGLVDRIDGGELRTEDVLLFNPTGQSVDVTVRFHFADGRVVTERKSLDPMEVDDPDARLPIGALAGMATRFFITVEAEAPIVATLEHWGLAGPDGFAAPHGAVGEGVRVASLLG